MAECAYRMRAKATAGISADELAQLKSVCERIRLNLGDVSLPAPPDSSDCLPVSGSESDPAIELDTQLE